MNFAVKGCGCMPAAKTNGSIGSRTLPPACMPCRAVQWWRTAQHRISDRLQGGASMLLIGGDSDRGLRSLSYTRRAAPVVPSLGDDRRTNVRVMDWVVSVLQQQVFANDSYSQQFGRIEDPCVYCRLHSAMSDRPDRFFELRPTPTRSD